jgi:hypothetical protein
MIPLHPSGDASIRRSWSGCELYLEARGHRVLAPTLPAHADPSENVGRALALVTAAGLGGAATRRVSPEPRGSCGVDAVLAGPVCLDSSGQACGGYPIRPRRAQPGRKISLGRATVADLTAGGATQLGTARRLRALHGRRLELRQRHLRREPAVGTSSA